MGKQKKSDKNPILHYTHETRLHTYKQDIHQILRDTFQQTSVADATYNCLSQQSKYESRISTTMFSTKTANNHTQNQTKQPFVLQSENKS